MSMVFQEEHSALGCYMSSGRPFVRLHFAWDRHIAWAMGTDGLTRVKSNRRGRPVRVAGMVDTGLEAVNKRPERIEQWVETASRPWCRPKGRISGCAMADTGNKFRDKQC